MQPDSIPPIGPYTGPTARLVAVIIAFLAALGLAGCSTAAGSTTSSSRGQTSGSPNLSGLTLRIGDQVHLVQTLLESSGELKGLPFHLQWDDFSSGPPLLAALTSGDLDVGLVGDTPPVFAAANHESIRIVAASSEQGDVADAIVVPPGSSVRSVAQLKGKKVAVAEGTSANYTLLRALKKAGLSWSQITPVYLQPAEALAALRSGSIDAWAVWYPFVALAENQGAKVIATGQALDPGYGFVVSPPSSLANADTSDAIGEFLNRLRLAQAWADAHLSDWAADYARLTGLPVSAARATATIERHDAYLPLSPAVVTAEQQLADSFSAIGLISPLKVDGIFDDAFASDLES
jgi:sulfonate transport system substrate-binding protein